MTIFSSDKIVKTIIFVLIFLVFNCIPVKSEELNVTVTILPQKYFVEKIGGSSVKVNVMVDKGSDPHTYEPKPSKMVALSNSDIYFTISLPLEKVWIEKISGSNKKLKIIPMDKGLEKLGNEHHHNIKHDNLQEDPHTWLAPSRVRIMAENIRDAFIKEDSANRKIYQSNFLNFIKKINEVDSKIADVFLQCKKEKLVFMVYHPSFQYFAKSFGLNQIAIEAEGKEPTPKELQLLINTAKKENIKTIFIEPQSSKKSAQFIAKAIGAKLLEVDPLSINWGDNLIKFAESIACDE